MTHIVLSQLNVCLPSWSYKFIHSPPGCSSHWHIVFTVGLHRNLLLPSHSFTVGLYHNLLFSSHNLLLPSHSFTVGLYRNLLLPSHSFCRNGALAKRWQTFRALQKSQYVLSTCSLCRLSVQARCVASLFKLVCLFLSMFIVSFVASLSMLIVCRLSLFCSCSSCDVFRFSVHAHCVTFVAFPCMLTVCRLWLFCPFTVSFVAFLSMLIVCRLYILCLFTASFVAFLSMLIVHW